MRHFHFIQIFCFCELLTSFETSVDLIAHLEAEKKIMTAEIPEMFRALLEHPFTLPNFDENGKWLSDQTVQCVSLEFACSTVT